MGREVVVSERVLSELLGRLEESGVESDALAEVCVQDALVDVLGEREEGKGGVVVTEVEVMAHGGLSIETEGLSDHEAERLSELATCAFMSLTSSKRKKRRVS